MEMRVDTRGDASRVWCGFVCACNIDLQDPSEADLELDGAVLIEKIIPDVFCGKQIYQGVLELTGSGTRTVICKRADHAYH